nr:transposase [Sporomusa silvacetica]
MLRGINRQIIFEDDEDRVKFIDTLKHYKQICGFNVFAYCLMDNHVHLIIKVNNESLGETWGRFWCFLTIYDMIRENALK